MKYIGGMSIDSVIAYIQEILTEDQLEKEFKWSLSEIAYPYNKSTKKSEFKAMRRPYWMLADAPEIKKIRMLKSLVPVGNVQDISGMQNALAKQETKTA